MSDVVCRSLQYTNRLNYGVSHDLDDLALRHSSLSSIFIICAEYTQRSSGGIGIRVANEFSVNVKKYLQKNLMRSCYVA